MSAEPRQALFRKEVLEHRAERLHGDVNLAVPVSWQLISFTLLAALVVAGLFLGMASYSRVATVAGAIVLDRGVAPIVPTRPGIVTALHAREGQRVAAGSPLVQIRSEEDMAGGGTAPRRIVEALEQQDARLASQGSLLIGAAAAERSRLEAQVTGLGREITSLNSQIEEQRRLVEVAANDFKSTTDIASKGFISRRELESREAALVSRRQQLAQLEQAKAAKESAMAEARRGMTQSGVSAQAQAAGVQSNRAELAQQVAQAEAAQGYTLKSPIDGTLTALTARLGQPATSEQPLMVIMPADATPRVELYVPTSAAGFLEIGQEVRLAVDAFPYQRFGTVRARISQISTVAIPKVMGEAGAVPVYLVTAELAEPSVTAFGRKQPLLPGMTLSARIVTQKQSLFEWLFEPLFAVGNR